MIQGFSFRKAPTASSGRNQLSLCQRRYGCVTRDESGLLGEIELIRFIPLLIVLTSVDVVPPPAHFTLTHVPPSRQMNSTQPSTASPSPASIIFDA